MSSSDEETRRLPSTEAGGREPPPPARGPARGPITREREVIEDDGWRAHVAEQLRNIRAGLIALALVSLIALGLGVYLLATRDDDGDAGNRNAAAREQVSELDRRVERLESQLENRASEGDFEEIQESQSQITERLDALEQQAGQDDTEQLEQTIDSLSGQVDELSQRVDRLEEEQQEGQ